MVIIVKVDISSHYSQKLNDGLNENQVYDQPKALKLTLLDLLRLLQDHDYQLDAYLAEAHQSPVVFLEVDTPELVCKFLNDKAYPSTVVQWASSIGSFGAEPNYPSETWRKS